MKKLVELQLATKPRGSSISASSAPAWMAWISAWIRFSRLCELRRRSKTSGPLVRKVEVKSERPRAFDSGLGVFHSATMTTVALPITKRGSWFGVRFDAARHHQPDVRAVGHAFFASVSSTACVSSARVRPMSSAIEVAPS